MFSSCSLLLSTLLVIALLFLTTDRVRATESFFEMMFVLDGSGSMWGKAGNEVKIGLTAYGHNRKGDCSDIEILLPPAPQTGNSFCRK